VEAATGDYYGGHRPGDNLFSTSLVALDALTGERVWHFQIIRNDIFDWDNPTNPILADFTVDGRRVNAVVQLTKQAIAYVFDRYTGEPIWPMIDTPVPVSDTPGERSSPTQPIPTKPLPYDRTGVTHEILIDFTPELRAEAIEAIQPFTLGWFFVAVAGIFVVVTGLRNLGWTALGRGIAIYITGTTLVVALAAGQIRRGVTAAPATVPGQPAWAWPQGNRHRTNDPGPAATAPHRLPADVFHPDGHSDRPQRAEAS
jgi:hypothetical protein